MKKSKQKPADELGARFVSVDEIEDPKKFKCVAKGCGYNFLVHAVSQELVQDGDSEKLIVNENHRNVLWMVTRNELIEILLMLSDTHFYRIQELDKMSQEDWDYLNENYPQLSKREQLEIDLNKAVSEESYELAAKIRNQINKLK